MAFWIDATSEDLSVSVLSSIKVLGRLLNITRGGVRSELYETRAFEPIIQAITIHRSS